MRYRYIDYNFPEKLLYDNRLIAAETVLREDVIRKV